MIAAFWSGFWPNFAATILAVVAGVPIGLWLDQRVERSTARARAVELKEADRQRVLEEITRTREALEHLEPAIRAHTGWFAVLGTWGNLNEYYEGPLEELWLTLRGEIGASYLSDRRLFGDLAMHFERCRRLDELVRLRASLSMAGPSAQHERMLTDEGAIKARLNNMTKAAGAAPENIANRVAAEIVSLRAQQE